MAAVKNNPFRVETEFVNEWASDRRLDLKINLESVAPLGGGRPDLADIIHVLRSGEVTASDMLEQRGLWIVVGETTDGELLLLEVAVASEEGEIELLYVVKMEGSGN